MTQTDGEREVERQLAVMRRGSVDFYGEDELRPRLATAIREGRPLRVKLGFDPTSPHIHLGHSVVLSKLRRFQELGHRAIFLVGDFTARIGDPSGRKKTRPPLAEDEIRANASTYIEQASKVLDVDAAEVRYNSEWMNSLTPADFVRLCSHYTVARLLERDDFAKRYAAGEPVAVHEFLYPFAQAYDSVALRADVELGGSDQTFNLLMAREIQRAYGQPPQAVITHPLLVGLDGHEKMSKSLGNAIGVTDGAEEMYGRVMSISDALMLDWFEQLEAEDWSDLRALREALAAGREGPLAFKQGLATAIVTRFHGTEAAEAAERHFQRVVRRKEVPEDLPEKAVPLGDSGRCGLLELIATLGFASSKSEARRLVTQGAVKLDGSGVNDPTLYLEAGQFLLQVGKRRFARVKLA